MSCGSTLALASTGSRLWQKRFVLPVKRRVREGKMNFPLSACAKLAHCSRFGLLDFQHGGVSILREACLQSAALAIRMNYSYARATTGS
jgi:hypothetical protein